MFTPSWDLLDLLRLMDFGRWWVTSALRLGPIPTHIGVIMDGNRRWAKKKGCETKVGHKNGFERFHQALEWCLDLGIEVITVYAWSIENFKRPKQEVDYLMEMAIEKINLLLTKSDIIERHNVRVKMLGNLKLLPIDVQRAFANVMDKTKNNSRVTLNVCFSYTSQDEICHAVSQMSQAVNNNILLPSDVTEDLLEESLYLERPVDLLIRTSGEKRLSDFLLWQSSLSCVVILDVLWPDFSPWDLYWAIIIYQKNYRILDERRETYRRLKEEKQLEYDKTVTEFLVGRDERRESYRNFLQREFNEYISDLVKDVAP